MPYNGSGTFISLTPPNYPAVAGQPIYASQFNINLTDLFGGLSNAVTRDGQSPAGANLPMNGYKHTGVGTATAAGQYLVYGQGLVGSTGRFGGAVYGIVGTRSGGAYGGAGPNSAYDDLVVETGTGSGGLSILTTSANTGAIAFGDEVSSVIGRIVYDHVTDTMALWAAGASQLAISSTGLVLRSGIGLTMTGAMAVATLTASSTITATGGFIGNVTGNVTGSSGSTTGNAATATALQTARTINGTSFNGTANITVPTSVVTDSTAADQFPLFAAAVGNSQSRINSGLKFNPSTNVLTVGSEVIAAANTATDDYSLGYKKVVRSTSATISRLYCGFCKALSAGVTIPSATFEAGDSFSIYNNSAAAITITQGGGLTMYGPAAATGNRTLAARGMCTIWFNSASDCKIVGEVT